MSIPISEQQREAIRAYPGQPIEVVDEADNRCYVLIAVEQYRQIRDRLEEKPLDGSPTAKDLLEVPPGILRSQQAFWRDLPDLLKFKRNHGKWVGYHLDERIGIAKTQVELLRECLRRQIPGDAWFITVIEKHEAPPWEEEEVVGMFPDTIDECE